MVNRGGSRKDPFCSVLIFIMEILYANSIIEKIFIFLSDSL
jgi:hypothetical protein